MARGIKDKVAILGMGCSNFGERWESGAEELMVEAFEEAVADAGIDTSALEEPKRAYSALDWTSAGIEGPDGVEAQVRKYEADVLDAYDRAIEPYAAGDAELQFLTQQYEALSEKLGGLTPDRAAA